MTSLLFCCSDSPHLLLSSHLKLHYFRWRRALCEPTVEWNSSEVLNNKNHLLIKNHVSSPEPLRAPLRWGSHRHYLDKWQLPPQPRQREEALAGSLCLLSSTLTPAALWSKGMNPCIHKETAILGVMPLGQVVTGNNGQEHWPYADTTVAPYHFHMKSCWQRQKHLA